MSNKDISFLGTGWGFPPTFRKPLGGVEMLSGEADVQSSIHILLSTEIGERIMQPTYGLNLRPYVFENMTVSTQAMIQKIVQEALIYHEPRIVVDGVTTTVDEPAGKLLISIDYRIITTNTRYNYVYPFYLTEATNLVR